MLFVIIMPLQVLVRSLRDSKIDRHTRREPFMYDRAISIFLSTTHHFFTITLFLYLLRKG